MQEVNDYLMSMVGSFTFPSPTSLVGNFTITASNSGGDFCQWDETWNGIKQWVLESALKEYQEKWAKDGATC